MNTGRPSDLVEASRVEQFMALYSSHQRRLHLYTLALLPVSPDADDVFQEANLVLWQKFNEYQAGTNFFAWACKIIRYKVLQYREKASRSVTVLDPDILGRLANLAVAQMECIDEFYSRALNDCMARLSTNDRELMQQRYIEGMPVQAIATAMNRSPNAISQSMGRIRRLLFDCINNAINNPSQSGGKP